MSFSDAIPVHHITVVEVVAPGRPAAQPPCARLGPVPGDVVATCALGCGRSADIVFSLCMHATSDRRAIGDVMRRDVVCVREDVGSTTLSWLLDRNPGGVLPVVDVERRPQGIVTRAAFVRACGEPRFDACEDWRDIVEPGPQTSSLTAAALMMPAATVGGDDDIATALHHLRDRRARVAVVVDEDTRLVGVVSLFDLFGAS